MEGFIYKNYDGLGLAKLIKNKELQSKEVLTEAIKTIEKHNPTLNAVINKFYEKAERHAENVDLTGTFAGVPMLLKDIAQEVAGEKITQGSKAFQNYRAQADSEYIKQVRKTGAVFVGQTNVPEFALMGITEPQVYGPTRNPWNLDHTPGGSSGGSAAAVASGMVPIAGANDGGGSIRIPGAYCGLFGMKPTRGRTPVGPKYGRNWQGASVDHILSRSVRDSAAMLDEIKVFEKAAAFHAPPFEGSYLQMMKVTPVSKLRVAFSVRSPLGSEVHQDCKEAVYNAARLLESMGHHVEEVDAPVDGRKIAKSYLTMYFGEVAAAIASLEEILGRKAVMTDVEQTTWILGLVGKATSAEEVVLSIREWDHAAYSMEIFHETYDFYMTPTTAFPPANIGELEPKKSEKLAMQVAGKLSMGGILKKAGIVEQVAENNLMRTPFTQLANLTGQPAMTVPLHLTADGLPVGVQFMAARGREDLLYSLAEKLEQSELWVPAEKNPMFLL
ncbi:amidase family protein [Ureibacillus manganicus]|uniref:6-aminohexanoate hydrolase n=1 Tax=Ureibacillus manganicus DSM 26584 TaxID=1384049 RepID=A0A0A3I369_9BACL|nr:amidase family protein [Ureibacillus manganicus]KGR79174.1 6-aminohexanoate hydrolase [Ureibacillus manganicus DSM 26584]